MAKSPLQLAQNSKDTPISAPTFNASKPITKDVLEDLINTFVTVPYRSEDARSREYLEICWHFLKRDYKVGQVWNKGGVLCSHYPPIILIPEQEVARGGKENGAVITKGLDECVRRYGSLNVEEIGAGSELAEVPAQLSDWVHVDHDDGEFTKSFDSNSQNHTWQYDDAFAIPDKTDLIPETSLNGSKGEIKTPEKNGGVNVNNVVDNKWRKISFC